MIYGSKNKNHKFRKYLKNVRLYKKVLRIKIVDQIEIYNFLPGDFSVGSTVYDL